MEHVTIGLDLFSNTTETRSIGATHLPRPVPVLGDCDRDPVSIHLGPEGGQVADEVVPINAVSNGLRAELGAVEYVGRDGAILWICHDAVNRGLGLLPKILILCAITLASAVEEQSQSKCSLHYQIPTKPAQ